jgi:serine-type D-Ala-D-Ala carboxypeptidase/endopeptidase (penicillin-binding protein 4)
MTKAIRLLSIVLVLGFSRYAQTSQESILGQRLAELASEYHSEEVQCGLLVEDLENSRVIYSKNADLLLNPASNMKILTTFAALSKLGPNYRFKTQLLGAGDKGSGHLNKLILKGYGDPTFTTARLEAMVQQLKSNGINSVDQVLIDDTQFDRSDFPGRLEDRQKDSPFNATVGALSLDDNVLEVVCSPGEKAGQPAEVSLSPPLSRFPLQGEVHTTGKRAHIIVKNVEKFPGEVTIAINGTIPPKASPLKYRIGMNHPTQVVGLRLLELLKSQGIQAPGLFQMEAAPSNSTILVEDQSPPLSLILQDINKKSNNFMAEQVTEALGALIMGIPGNTQKGIEAIQKQLKGLGIDLSGVFLENGSGLSQKTRVRARTLADVLHKAYFDTRLQNDFISSLSVLGVDGTLKRKFHSKDLQGYFVGKTGTLNGVTALSGYVFRKSAPQRPPFIFTFIANGRGKDFWQQRDLQQKILELLINQ